MNVKVLKPLAIWLLVPRREFIREARLLAMLVFALLAIPPASWAGPQQEDPETEAIVAFYRKANEAVTDLKRRANAGHAESQFVLGAAYYDQGLPGLEHDETQALPWLLKSAGAGYAEAMTALAVIHAQGRVVPASESESDEWLRKAGSGDRRAIFLRMYRQAGGRLTDPPFERMGALALPRDLAFENAWYKEQAQLGNAEAARQGGWNHGLGRGVERSELMGIAVLIAAAKNGSAQAGHDLTMVTRNKASAKTTRELSVVLMLNEQPVTIAQGTEVRVLVHSADDSMVYFPSRRSAALVPTDALRVISSANHLSSPWDP
ncbi:tetratricopeptide repeat protein [Luteimonas sp. e5]